jgi:adenosylmethionine-8-amino-7-oxononanoate aminotransferase
MNWTDIDRQHIWHPYSAIGSDVPVFPVVSARGTRIHLQDGRELIDGMASWWCVIHGYNHPEMNRAIENQLHKMAHVMFGGLTHEPAAKLAQKLIEITPGNLQCVFFADSGSVSVEIALKMAIQYWYARGQSGKQRFITVRNGYHGDTFGAMSVCDPGTGMHSLFSKILPQQIFIEAPRCKFGEPCTDDDVASLRQQLQQHHAEIAAIILEPIVQGAGGMRFYSAEYLKRVRELCDEFRVLLILDEIATGFGRSGKLFACEHAGIAPDILCIGKALTGGYMTLAATLTTRHIAETIQQVPPHVFMHGPTFMANPLACAAALASIELLLNSDWQSNIRRIESGLKIGLEPCKHFSSVADVRVLGAIGVVEMKQPVNMKKIQPQFVDAGVWVRPFGKLIYLMPAFVMDDRDLAQLTRAVCQIVENIARPDERVSAIQDTP